MNKFKINKTLITLTAIALLGASLTVITKNTSHSARAIPAGDLPQGKVMAWIFPGEPACGAMDEIADGRRIDVLKPEYYQVSYTGDLRFLTETDYGCNAYSEANVAKVKKYSSEQFVTVASAYTGMVGLVSSPTKRQAAINELVTFVNNTGFTGVEIDFEDYGTWTKTDYANYKLFLTQLGDALHASGKQLMVDVPPMEINKPYAYYELSYADFNTLPVDYMVIMAYDHAFDEGVDAGLSPHLWVINVIKRAQAEITDPSKIVMGIPSYGYIGKKGTYSIDQKTYDQLKDMPGFASAVRHSASSEMTFTRGDQVYFYSDSKAVSFKKLVANLFGIYNVSVWHLGGNEWFDESR